MKTLKEFILENELKTEERNKLKDSDFGIPEKRAFPLIDAEHVRNALSRFHFAKETDKRELAKNIKAAASKFKVEISEDNKINEY